MQQNSIANHVAPRVNVLGGELQVCSTDPVSGFLRTGFCDSSRLDHGDHTVAAIVSDEFLKFSAERGNELRESATMFGGAGGQKSVFPGLKGGCKWCLCAGRWKEAFDARERYGDAIVPKILLEATHKDALNTVSLQELQKFAAPSLPKAAGGSGKSEL